MTIVQKECAENSTFYLSSVTAATIFIAQNILAIKLTVVVLGDVITKYQFAHYVNNPFRLLQMPPRTKVFHDILTHFAFPNVGASILIVVPTEIASEKK